MSPLFRFTRWWMRKYIALELPIAATPPLFMGGALILGNVAWLIHPVVGYAFLAYTCYVAWMVRPR